MGHLSLLLLQTHDSINVLLQLLNQIPELQDNLWEQTKDIKIMHLGSTHPKYCL